MHGVSYAAHMLCTRPHSEKEALNKWEEDYQALDSPLILVFILINRLECIGIVFIYCIYKAR